MIVGSSAQRVAVAERVLVADGVDEKDAEDESATEDVFVACRDAEDESVAVDVFEGVADEVAVGVPERVVVFVANKGDVADEVLELVDAELLDVVGLPERVAVLVAVRVIVLVDEPVGEIVFVAVRERVDEGDAGTPMAYAPQLTGPYWPNQ